MEAEEVISHLSPLTPHLSPLTSHLSKLRTMKKETWKTIIQMIVSILTAALTAMGTTSCMGRGPF